MLQRRVQVCPTLIRVLVVDDHPVMLEGLVSVLERTHCITVVGRESGSVGGLRAWVKLKPDVTILASQLDDAPSAIIVEVIRRQDRHARFIILSELSKDNYIVQGLRCGAVGYIGKNSSPEEIVACVERVHAGHRHVAPIAAMKLRASVRFDGLTEREEQIIELLGKDRTNKEIGAALGISENTVRSHMKGVLMKLNARTRTEAILVAIECGLLPPSAAPDGTAGHGNLLMM
jgi:two-component system NarL family response regulator